MPHKHTLICHTQTHICHTHTHTYATHTHTYTHPYATRTLIPILHYILLGWQENVNLQQAPEPQVCAPIEQHIKHAIKYIFPPSPVVPGAIWPLHKQIGTEQVSHEGHGVCLAYLCVCVHIGSYEHKMPLQFTLYNKWGRNEMTAILLYSSLSLKII